MFPFFSVIITAYNSEAYIVRSIESVLRQTYVDFELLVIDDGSTDSTVLLCKEIGDTRLRLIETQHSGLPAVARNRGIGLAKGAYVAFLDADDYWTSDKLEKIYNYLQYNRDAVAVSHDEYLIRNGRKEERLFHKPPLHDRVQYVDLLLEGNSLSTSAMVVKQSIAKKIGGFNEDKSYFIVEDYDFWLKVSIQGRIGYVPEALGYYIVDGLGISSNISLSYRNLRYLLTEHKEILHEMYPLKIESLSALYERTFRDEFQELQATGQVFRAFWILLIIFLRHPALSHAVDILRFIYGFLRGRWRRNPQ